MPIALGRYIPPLDYMTADGKAAGYNVALLTAIAEKIQLNIRLVFGNEAFRVMMITSGKSDVIFCTEQNAAFLFS